MSQDTALPTETANLSRRAFVPLCLCFVAGILLARVMPVPAPAWAAVFLICVAGVILRRSGKAFFAAVLAGCFFGGAAWYSLRATPLPDDLSHFISDQPAEIQGFVLQREVRSQGRVSLKVRVQHLAILEGKRSVSGLVVVYPKAEATARPGDQVRCVGRLQSPPQASNWGQFSYEDYLEEHGIHAVFFADVVEAPAVPDSPLAPGTHAKSASPDSPAPDISWERTLAGFVGRAQESIYSHLVSALPGRNRSLLATILGGILFGNKSYPMPDSLEEIFRRSGTIHVMVVSGTQVSLIAAFVLLLMRRLPLPPQPCPKGVPGQTRLRALRLR